MIALHLNGREMRLAAENVEELMAVLGLAASLHLVEHNGTALLRSEWVETRLREGDRIEVLRVSAGG